MPLKNWLGFQKSKAFIESLGGTVEYYSKPLEGSVTTLKIPCEKIPLEHLKLIFKHMAEREVQRFRDDKRGDQWQRLGIQFHSLKSLGDRLSLGVMRNDLEFLLFR